MKYLFSLFKRKSSPFYQVRFKNSITGKNGTFSHDAMDLIRRARSLEMSEFEVEKLIESLIESRKIIFCNHK